MRLENVRRLAEDARETLRSVRRASTTRASLLEPLMEAHIAARRGSDNR